MIKKLSISNYKSIQHLEIDTRRVNIFIGEHNSGKSNILEALTWFSVGTLDRSVFPDVFRFKNSSDFFYDFDVSNPAEIKTDELCLGIKYAKNANGTLRNQFEGLIYPSESISNFVELTDLFNLHNKLSNYFAFTLSYDGTLEPISGASLQTPFRTYIFKRLKAFQDNFRPYLNPPFGDNIPSLLISNKSYQEVVRGLFKSKGFRLMLKPAEGDISMAKDVNDELYAYPYQSISETIQRMVFYQLAIESNKNSTLVLDEPESNTFPMYTKQLAELIAADGDNQYFIATHNPYLLSSLVSKTPINEISVFVTKMDQYKTSVKKIKDGRLSQLLDSGIDFYFNLDKLTE